MDRFSRLETLIGNDITKLKQAHVAIVGLGGVGSHAAEAIARAGVGRITIIDHDTVAVTNINRQIPALTSTVGEYKAEVMRDRIMDINPDAEVIAHREFYAQDSRHLIKGADYIIDAIDTVSSKLNLILHAKEEGIQIISCMGTAGKMCPELLEIADIYSTSVCPLCRVMRKELKDLGIESLDVVYSKEPNKPSLASDELIKNDTRKALGSTPFVPPAAGILAASWVFRKLVSP